MAANAGFTDAQYTFINETIGNATAGPYADVGVGFVLQSAYLVFFMHCGFAMVGLPHFLAADFPYTFCDLDPSGLYLQARLLSFNIRS